MTRLDWSRAKMGEPRPCILCDRPAFLRHPQTGAPCHKVCSDAEADAAPRGEIVG